VAVHLRQRQVILVEIMERLIQAEAVVLATVVLEQVTTAVRADQE